MRNSPGTTSIVFLAFLLALSLGAQEPEASTPTDGEPEAAQTAVVEEAPSAAIERSPEIPLDELKLRLKPLSLGETEIEVEAWIGLLRSTLDRIVDLDVRKLRISRQSEDGGPSAEEREAEIDRLNDNLVDLHLEQAAVIQRLDAVLDATEAKGGDPTLHRQYLASVGRVESLNAGSAQALLSAWLRSDSGGLLLGKRIGVFFAILLGSWLLGRLLSRIAFKAVVRGKGSQLLQATVRIWVRSTVIVVGAVVGISALGVDIGPLLALIGAAGFAIGFALRDSLSNFASGALILFYQIGRASCRERG